MVSLTLVLARRGALLGVPGKSSPGLFPKDTVSHLSLAIPASAEPKLLVHTLNQV